LAARFAAAMARLGPFGAAPKLAVGVSGGADSTALALLARDWVAEQGGALLALIVDHGLRAESATEAALTAGNLAAHGIAAQVLPLRLAPGPKLQERARNARHAVLAQAARAAGAVFLALGHHAGDQAETVAMRAARGRHGLEGMAGWTARADVVLLRPLLNEPPALLRAWLQARGVAWVEDPSNADETYERVRIRLAGTGVPPETAAGRVAGEHDTAAFLAAHAVLRPEGFAVLRADAALPRALGALLRAVGGATYAPDAARTAALAANLRVASLGGVVLARTGKCGGGWLLAREPAACAAPVPALAGAIWDGRFRLETPMKDAACGALGADAAAHRRDSDLPSVVLRGLPCLRAAGQVIFPVAAARFRPPAPIAPHPFHAAQPK
jgi:tRNA(Ile)-lysidine synthase